MIKVEQSVVTNRPVEEVWAYLTGIDNVPQWNSAIPGGKMTSRAPIGAGTTGLRG
jgi:uncharacterized membrane protein